MNLFLPVNLCNKALIGSFLYTQKHTHMPHVVVFIVSYCPQWMMGYILLTLHHVFISHCVCKINKTWSIHPREAQWHKRSLSCLAWIQIIYLTATVPYLNCCMAYLLDKYTISNFVSPVAPVFVSLVYHVSFVPQWCLSTKPTGLLTNTKFE